jgi:tetratricopeptide (TPR) repeat protein
MNTNKKLRSIVIAASLAGLMSCGVTHATEEEATVEEEVKLANIRGSVIYPNDGGESLDLLPLAREILTIDNFISSVENMEESTAREEIASILGDLRAGNTGNMLFGKADSSTLMLVKEMFRNDFESAIGLLRLASYAATQSLNAEEFTKKGKADEAKKSEAKAEEFCRQAIEIFGAFEKAYIDRQQQAQENTVNSNIENRLPASTIPGNGEPGSSKPLGGEETESVDHLVRARNVIKRWEEEGLPSGKPNTVKETVLTAIKQVVAIAEDFQGDLDDVKIDLGIERNNVSQMKEEVDKLQAKIKELTEENDKLRSNYDKLVNENNVLKKMKEVANSAPAVTPSGNSQSLSPLGSTSSQYNSKKNVINTQPPPPPAPPSQSPALEEKGVSQADKDLIELKQQREIVEQERKMKEQERARKKQEREQKQQQQQSAAASSSNTAATSAVTTRPSIFTSTPTSINSLTSHHSKSGNITSFTPKGRKPSRP